MWAVRACGARERERRERSGEGRGHRAERGRRERDSIADGTALRCGRGGSRHFRRHRGFIPEGSFRGHYPKYTSSNAVWLKVLGCAPLSPEIENCWGPRTNEICAESLRATATYSPFFCLSINLSVKKCRNAVTTARRERSEHLIRGIKINTQERKNNLSKIAARLRTPY